jgi:hypothetical protein
VTSKRTGLTVACIVALSPYEVLLAQSLEEAVRACAAETDVLRRLACYDRAAAQLVGEHTPGAAPASSTADRDGPRTVSPEARFGVRNGPLDERKYATAPKEITATVILIEMRRLSGALVVSLDNDQVWVENQPSEYFPLKVGDTVRIRSAALGAYMMFAPSKRATRVTRIR